MCSTSPCTVTIGSYETRYRRIAADARYTNMAANRLHFDTMYRQVAAERRPLAWWTAHDPALAAQPEFPMFYRQFYSAIAEAAAAVTAGD